jgi:hypothetical protein
VQQNYRKSSHIRTGQANGYFDTLKLVSSANGHHLEADLAKGIAVEDHAPIKHERGFFHRVVHGAPVDLPELLPLGRDDDRFTVLRS